MKMMSKLNVALAALGVSAGVVFAEDAKLSSDQVQFFETKIRPILADNCYKCHSAESEKVKAGLYMDTRDGLLKGGNSGPIIVPGDPEKSLMIKAVRYTDPDLQMPPKDKKLSDAQINDLVAWVKMGAPDPRAATAGTGKKWSKAGREHWAFQPVRKQPVPAVKNRAWVMTPVDAFVLAKLEAAGMQPSPAADRPTLIRRAYFDLVGLPPTAEEIYNYMNDPSPDWFAKVVERLLASSHYGERWGRHWLDTARYADTRGDIRERLEEPYYPHAWTYRDYVIKSFNEDKPYDRFIVEQLAADKLPEAEKDKSLLAATGFLTVGRAFRGMKNDVIDDRIDVVSKGFLGMTVACARCHDHKFDPIPTADYYSWHGIFNSSVIPEELPIIKMPERESEYREYLEKIEPMKQTLKQTEEKLVQLRKERRAGALNQREVLRTEYEIGQIKTEAAKLDMNHPGAPVRAMALSDSSEPHDSPIFVRGEAGNRGPIAPRRFLEILSKGERQTFSDGSGRLELARAIASKDNPMTARAMVNRIWLHHFGQAFVPTPDDLGNMSEPPTHPELLDWLAAYFMENGWSIKKMHWLIMLSSAYQQGSANNPAYVQSDPDNHLLWRANVRRLDFEVMRDNILALGGKLDRAMYGPPVMLDESSRRTVYSFIDRRNVADVFTQFDFANPDMSMGRRNFTTVPQQALFLMNSPTVVETARALINVDRFARLLTDGERLSYIYWHIYQRPPTHEEYILAMKYLAGASSRQPSSARTQTSSTSPAYEKVSLEKKPKRKPQDPEGSKGEKGNPLNAWQKLVHALLMSSEAAYVN
ncbi:MAG: PSD1 domain-containing protein [Verrucomicrobia bacterium]|nr:PSD1 domain-containing protein [Verrucomicrobiota bacterium]